MLQLPSWTVSSISRPISANQQCDYMLFAGLGRTEGLEELLMSCMLRQRWAVLVKDGEVGGRSVIMVAMKSGFTGCSDSSVHYT